MTDLAQWRAQAEADGWSDVNTETLRNAAIEAMAWSLLDQTSDVADREPSEDDFRAARATAERFL